MRTRAESAALAAILEREGLRPFGVYLGRYGDASRMCLAVDIPANRDYGVFGLVADLMNPARHPLAELDLLLGAVRAIQTQPSAIGIQVRFPFFPWADAS